MLLGVLEHVSFAKVSDGRGKPLACTVSGGVVACGDDATQAKGLKTRLFRCDVTPVAADSHPVIAAAPSVLEDLDARALWRDLTTKSRNFGIPNELVPRIRFQGIDRPLCKLTAHIPPFRRAKDERQKLALIEFHSKAEEESHRIVRSRAKKPRRAFITNK